jgi:hypothetical protein
MPQRKAATPGGGFVNNAGRYVDANGVEGGIPGQGDVNPILK